MASVAVAGEAPVAFSKQQLVDRYYCDGVTAGDINRDGKPDVVAGPFWFAGPEFTSRNEFYPAAALDPAASPSNSMFSYVDDFNGDGWPDILVLGRVHLHQAFWYENPRGQPGHWKKHFAFHRVFGESPPFIDVDGDRRPELVAHWENRWGIIRPERSDPTQPWRFVPFTSAGQWHHFYHGTGVGDVNADGRLDLILNDGWFEQPGRPDQPWAEHKFRFADKGGAQMFALDVDGDGDNDVVTALDAHGWGLAWFEQLAQQSSEPAPLTGHPLPARAARGEGRGEGQAREKNAVTFRRHLIMGSRSEESQYGVAFSQPHALAMADLDGDGLIDIVAGKRRWAHGPKGDVEPEAEPVVYWFRLVRQTKGSARFVPYRIDAQSGVGVQITVGDVTGDGRPDVLTASKLGVFVFRNEQPRSK